MTEFPSSTRLRPSPTGFLDIEALDRRCSTALRQRRRQMLLRIEDTDRSVDGTRDCRHSSTAEMARTRLGRRRIYQVQPAAGS